MADVVEHEYPFVEILHQLPVGIGAFFRNGVQVVRVDIHLVDAELQPGGIGVFE